MNAPIEPYRIEVPDRVLTDLAHRLGQTRWPDQLPNVGWSTGADLDTIESICRYWASDYDWRAVEARLNELPQFTTEIDGERIHFVHVESTHPKARPLMLLHGWPGSIIEFVGLVEALTQPELHGGSADDAFHVVIPSLPGFGFSGPTRQVGIGAGQMGAMVNSLMVRLGYTRYGIHGTDWGAIIATMLAGTRPTELVGAHVTFLMAGPPDDASGDELSDIERDDLAANELFQRALSGYTAMQGTRPQTLAYGLNDSPAGLAAWILDRFHLSSDHDGDVETAIDRETLVTNLMIYWVTETINSSMRIYYETTHVAPPAAGPSERGPVPIGHALFPREAMRFPRAWVAAQHHLTHWTRMERGGHFAGLETPESLVADIRQFFATI